MHYIALFRANRAFEARLRHAETAATADSGILPKGRHPIRSPTVAGFRRDDATGELRGSDESHASPASAFSSCFSGFFSSDNPFAASGNARKWRCSRSAFVEDGPPLQAAGSVAMRIPLQAQHLRFRHASSIMSRRKPVRGKLKRAKMEAFAVRIRRGRSPVAGGVFRGGCRRRAVDEGRGRRTGSRQDGLVSH